MQVFFSSWYQFGLKHAEKLEDVHWYVQTWEHNAQKGFTKIIVRELPPPVWRAQVQCFEVFWTLFLELWR